ncbi:MAG: hypothetical protein HY321_01015 [Armatimonadetes bacterium]|nr:hypothetical protein [Armatimonadota bacterium]
MTRSKKLVATVALAGVSLALAHTAAEAALCVWRKPDQDIKRFFPGADTYKTDFRTPGGKRAAIEKRIGARLDPDESEFKFYRIIDDGKQVGTILTHLGKGQYGAIEVVVALDNSGKVKGVGIQRDRERARAALRSGAFLGQFDGKSVKDPMEIGKDIKPAAKGAEKPSATVAFSVKKLLVLLDELG